MANKWHFSVMEFPLDYNIVRYFFEAVRKYPGRIAVADKQTSIAFGTLAQQVTDTARQLQACGIGPGDRVLVFVPISIDLYRIVLAIFRCGAVAVFAEEWANRHKLSEYLAIANCKAIISTRKILFLASLLNQTIRQIPVKINSRTCKRYYFPVKARFWRSEKYYFSAEQAYESWQATPDDEALVTFTTGSTGLPKAANRTHGFLRQQLNALLPCIYSEQAAIDTLITTDSERDMTLLPIVLLINLAIGRTSVLAAFNPRKPQTFQAREVIGQLQQHRVTSITASPYYVEQLAQCLLPGQAASLNIQKIFCGGAAIFPDVARKITQAFPQTAVHLVYGSTEAEPVARITANELLQQHPGLLLDRGLCVGYPETSIEVAIITRHISLTAHPTRVDFKNACCQHDQLGEICVRGPHVLQHYLNHAQVFGDNKYVIDNATIWHRTGDAGYLDAKGYLYLAGRCRELIDWQGNTYSPMVFENNVRQWLPNSQGTILGIAGQPCIIISGTTDPQQATQMLQEKFQPASQWPIHFVRQIPRDKRHFSKIDYEALRTSIRK